MVNHCIECRLILPWDQHPDNIIKHTIIIEVICGHDWVFFDKIANVLELKHIKCKTNNYNDVVKCIDSCEI